MRCARVTDRLPVGDIAVNVRRHGDVQHLPDLRNAEVLLIPSRGQRGLDLSDVHQAPAFVDGGKRGARGVLARDVVLLERR